MLHSERNPQSMSNRAAAVNRIVDTVALTDKVALSLLTTKATLLLWLSKQHCYFDCKSSIVALTFTANPRWLPAGSVQVNDISIIEVWYQLCMSVYGLMNYLQMSEMKIIFQQLQTKLKQLFTNICSGYLKVYFKVSFWWNKSEILFEIFHALLALRSKVDSVHSWVTQTVQESRQSSGQTFLLL